MTQSRRLLALLTAILTVAGCGSSTDDEPESQRSGAGVSRAATAPKSAVVDLCEDTRGTCKHLTNVDVDGDGTDDQVGISYYADRPGPQVAFGTSHFTTIVAINGTRHTIEQSVDGSPYTEPAEIYRGAFLLSRAQGSDIALHLISGQGAAEKFAVISWDGSRLVALPQPPTANPNTLQQKGIWFLGSSHGKQGSVKCRQPGEIAMVDLTAATQEGMTVPGGGRREENFYTFVGSKWQPTGSDNTADASFSYAWDVHKNAFDCKDQGTKP